MNDAFIKRNVNFEVLSKFETNIFNILKNKNTATVSIQFRLLKKATTEA